MLSARRLPALLLALALAGCGSTAAPSASEQTVQPAAGVREDTRMTQMVLDQLCLAFGERYLIGIGNACNAVERAVAEPERRARAHSFKLQAASSVYDICSGPNPFAKLMDLVLLVELVDLVWGREGLAAKSFGAEAAPPLVDALARGKTEAWALADQILKPEQRIAMEEMIRDWRTKNPGVESVAFVRFSDFADYRGKSILDGVPHGSGLMAPVSEAMRQLEETRLLAERGLFLAKRMPLLARWHAESYLNTALSHPELKKVTDAALRAVALAESLPAKVAEERAIILKTMEDREKVLAPMVQNVRETAADVKVVTQEAHALLKETEAVLKSADALAVRLAPWTPSPGAKVPEVKDVTEALRTSVKAMQETRALLESAAWTARVEEVNHAAKDRMDHAGLEAKRFADVATVRVAGLLVLGFVLAVAYRAISVRLGRAPKA